MRILFISLASILLSFSLVQANPLPKPGGMVILTLAGDVVNANRGPLEPKRDAFINGQDHAFSTAAAFDRTMLEQFDQHYVRVNFKDWPKPYGLRGPKLQDVLDAAGVDPSATVAVTALDGWTFEITPEMRASKDWILATRDEERALAIGGRGPTWLVFKPEDPDGMATEEEEGQWVWSIFFMQVN